MLTSSIKEGIIKHLLYEIEIAVEKLTSLKQKNCSILKKLDENEMLSFSWMSVFNELDANLTLAVRMFCILCGFNKKNSKKNERKSIKIAVCYAILLQSRCKECSLVQCILTKCLMENVCDSKVSALLIN